MKNNPLDDIVKCNIEISNPASDDETFDSILLIVPEPSGNEGETMDKTTAVSTADELLEYGFTVEDAAYMAASVAFSQSPAPAELYICIRQNVGGDTEDVGYEDIAVTLERAESEVEFYGVHLTDFKSSADMEAAAAWVEKNEKLLAFEYSDYDECPIVSGTYYRSFGLYAGNADGYTGSGQPAENKYAALAWMAKCFGYDPGTETWHLKELRTVVPSKLSIIQKKELAEKNISTFLRYAGCNCTVGGYTLAGEWIDVIRFRDWLKSEIQSSVFKVIQKNRKVPFTDNGITLIAGAMESVLKTGQNIGGIALTEYDENDEKIPGYKISVPRASDLTEEERKSRKLTGCHYTARLAGAIHLVEIEGFLTF